MIFSISDVDLGLFILIILLPYKTHFMEHKVELVAFGLYGYTWTNENARMLTNDMGLI